MYIIKNHRKERLFTYEYILKKRVKEMKREMLKNDNDTPIVILLKRIISYEKIIVPRLEVFEQIVASPPEQ